MTTAQYIIGDVLTVLPTLPAGSVDLVICSPPFLALRSYLPSDHPDKSLEHGSEATPAAFLAQLLDVTELLGAVLAPHGSLAIELGDTYSGSHAAGGTTEDVGAGAAPAWKTTKGMGSGGRRNNPLDAAMGLIGTSSGERARENPGQWPQPKSLCGVPAAYELSLAYGRNILALPGQSEWREFQPWRVRNHIAWCRPNPPVGSLGDKWRPATSYITVATRSPQRYWDDIPTRKEAKYGVADGSRTLSTQYEAPGQPARAVRAVDENGQRLNSNPAGAPLLDWWEITPTGFTSRLGQHFATFPDAIAIPLVEAMCPRRVCRTCGTPSRRIVKPSEWDHKEHPLERSARVNAGGLGTHRVNGVSRVSNPATVGWSTCGCPGTEQTREDGFHEGDGWRPGLVLDPYAGTGTVGVVATGHGRDAILIDLDARNAILAEERLGMFLTIKESAA